MVNGYCDDRFIKARNIFEKSLEDGFELGGAICLEVKGEKVLDLWGGYKDQDRNEAWEENTIVNEKTILIVSLKLKYNLPDNNLAK